MPRKKKWNHKIHIENNIARTPKGLFKIKTVVANGGKVIATFQPLRLGVETRDMAQIFIGSIILASPFLVTEEVWTLGQEISELKAVLFMILSLFALSVLLFFTRYDRITFEGHLMIRRFTQRLVITYLIAFVTVSLLLTLLGKAPWDVDTQLALKRVILITLPASLGGAAVDLLK